MKVARDAVPATAWQALDHEAVLHVRADSARWRLTGSGRLACLHGLVTSDLNALADGAQTYGALLTAKGMIVTPLWIGRFADYLTVEAPAAAAPVVEETFRRSMPPRLCTFENVTGSTAAVGLYGPAARAGALGPAAVPAVVRGAPGFDAVIDRAALDAAIAEAGATPAPAALLESCRILAGIPSLGAEIDAKTLPQEAGLEELGAISYTKGCYLGQETVARLHFRGHANRRLALLVLDGEPAAAGLDVLAEGAVKGRLTSACWANDLDAWVGLAVLRREVEDGAVVELAGGMKAVARVGRRLRDP